MRRSSMEHHSETTCRTWNGSRSLENQSPPPAFASFSPLPLPGKSSARGKIQRHADQPAARTQGGRHSSVLVLRWETANADSALGSAEQAFADEKPTGSRDWRCVRFCKEGNGGRRSGFWVGGRLHVRAGKAGIAGRIADSLLVVWRGERFRDGRTSLVGRLSVRRVVGAACRSLCRQPGFAGNVRSEGSGDGQRPHCRSRSLAESFGAIGRDSTKTEFYRLSDSGQSGRSRGFSILNLHKLSAFFQHFLGD